MFRARSSVPLSLPDKDEVLAALRSAAAQGAGASYIASGHTLVLGARVVRGEARTILTRGLRLAVPFQHAGERDVFEKIIQRVMDHVFESGALVSILIDRRTASAALSFVLLLSHEEMKRQGGYDRLADWAEARGGALIHRGRAYRRLARLWSLHKQKAAPVVALAPA